MCRAWFVCLCCVFVCLYASASCTFERSCVSLPVFVCLYSCDCVYWFSHFGVHWRFGDRLNHGPQMGRPNHGSMYGRNCGCTRWSRTVRGQAVVAKITTTADPFIWPVCSYDLFITSTISTVLVRTTMHGKLVPGPSGTTVVPVAWLLCLYCP
jgi:hypothetical protein